MHIKELCAKIREKRRELGLSIEEIVDKTKLNPSVVLAVEEGDLSNLSPIYAKGFVRIYAEFLKIDPGDALEEILHTTSAAPKKKKKVEPVSEPKKIEVKLKKDQVNAAKDFTPPFKKMVTVVITVLICFWVLGQFIKFTGGLIRKITTKSTNVQEAGNADDSSEIDLGAPAKGKTAVARLEVLLRAKRNCFVKAYVDSRMMYHGVLRKGAVELWKGKKEIELQIQDGSAVHIEVNGRELPALTSMRKPIKSLKITPSGISVKK